MEEIKYIKCNVDDFNIIQLTAATLEISEQEAVAIILEIGLYSLISFPTGDKKIDTKLSEGKFPELVQKLKATWCL